MPVFARFPALRHILPGTLAVAAGDSICQALQGRQAWDEARTARMTTTGLCLTVPLSQLVFNNLDKLVPGRSTMAVLKKACINSSMCVFFIAGSFLGNTLLAGQGLSAFRDKCEERLLPTYSYGLAYWSSASVAILKCVPSHLRGVGGAAAGVIWNVFLSSRINLPAGLDPWEARLEPPPRVARKGAEKEQQPSSGLLAILLGN